MCFIKNNIKVVVSVFVATMVVIAVTACGGRSVEQAPSTPTQQGADESQQIVLAGKIVADGSSTVHPISQAMAESFRYENPNVSVTIGVSGTGGGFKRFCRGETDISNASRPILRSEVKICEENNINFIEVPIAYDGITVVVHSDNDWVDHLTVAELNKIFRSSDFAVTWADIRNGFPDEKIGLFAPGADSGTLDYFSEVVTDGAHRSDDVAFSEDDNVLVIGISGTLNGIGYFGFSYYANNSDSLRAVPIVNDAGEPVLPSLESINTNSYNPLSRPLLMYVSVAFAQPSRSSCFC